MTKNEIRQQIQTIRKEMQTATGCQYIRLSEDLETLIFLLCRKH